MEYVLYSGIVINKCDQAQKKGVQCSNSVSEKWSLKDEIFPKSGIQKMKCFGNMAFKTWEVSKMWLENPLQFRG